MSVNDIYNRWVERANAFPADELIALGNDETALKDAFFQDLEFGTGGLRGIIGIGTNRMNIYTVGRATQGLADYLNARYDAPSVAVCRDSRNMGETFARVAAQVLAGNGVHVHIYPRIEPTPALSFAVRDLGCSAGINVTASHNPAAYNGYKVYGPDGCQITTQASRDIQEAIGRVDIFDGVKSADFDEAVASGLIDWIGEDTLDRYIDAVAGSSLSEAGAAGDAKVVYTPLNGAGLECVTRILERIGIQDVVVVPEQAEPDGNFPTCPYPNPEIREALQKGLELCEGVHPDLLLATDPDSDRVGIAVPHDGEYVLLTGNEVGVMLLDFACRRRLELGKGLEGQIAITTIVSTAMVDALARDFGIELRRTLTGFKYIGEQIGMLEEKGEEDRFIFGFEESYGYLAGSAVRDKDAVVASMLICEMAAWHKAAGRDLVDAMDELYERYGCYGNRTSNFQYPGADGAARMKELMSSLRENPPAEVAGLPVQAVVDYAPGAPMPILNGDGAPQTLPEANVIEFQVGEGTKLIVRPSGTEPKIKAYLFAHAGTAEEMNALLDALAQSAQDLLG